MTDANGNYTFSGLGIGSFQVAEVVQTNWVQTQPSYPTSYSFTTKPGMNLNGLTFGDYFANAFSPTSVIDNGQSGYTETGTWKTATGGFNGNNRTASVVHSGKGTAKATWAFTVTPGATYAVYLTFAGKSNYAQSAPFTVYDGTTSLGTMFIDESILVTQAQGGFTEGSYGGVGWIDIGSYTPSGSSLNVVLSNLIASGGGSLVDADGVAIVQTSTGAGPNLASLPPGSSSSNGTSAGPVGMAALDLSTGSTPTGTSGKSTTPVVILSGVSQAAPLTVVYSQGTQPVVNQAAPTVVDAVLGLTNGDGGTSGSTSTGNIAALAKALLSGKKASA